MTKKEDMENRINKIEDLVAKGVTQDDIAKIMDTSQKTVSQLISDNIDKKFAEIENGLPNLKLEGTDPETASEDKDNFKCPNCEHEDGKAFEICPKCNTGLYWGE